MSPRGDRHVGWLGCVLALCSGAAPASADTYVEGPGTYLSRLNPGPGQLQPGDTLVLTAGTYTNGLPIDNLNGTASDPIVITGPTSGAPAVFEARGCCNTVSIRDSSYIEIRNLELDGVGLNGVDAVKAEGDASFAHHITIENLFIHGHGVGQQTVGINTKCPAWDWVVRGNVIAPADGEANGAGTGMYFGNSDGSAPFVNGLIEYNLVVDTVGYNIQIKHQTSRPALAGMPTSGQTLLRHNVLGKQNNASTGANARPNLLVGHWPLTGDGSDDDYLIYGNFFWYNDTGEALFQGEGNIALYDNLFVNPAGSAIAIQPHNHLPRRIRVFNNTVVAQTTGIRVTGGDAPAYQQNVIGNASFAQTPINAPAPALTLDNVTDTEANASNYVTNPTAAPGAGLDLYPLVGTLTGSVIDRSSFDTYVDWDRDFNAAFHDGTFRGAYAAEGTNAGWLPALEKKTLAVAHDFGDASDPSYPTLLANDGARHRQPSALFLGTSVDVDADGQPNATATGDDADGSDDEDGVALTSLLVPGGPATVNVSASVPGFLDAWIDFDGDGDWVDAGEVIFTNEPLAAGVNSLDFAVSTGAVVGTTVARFRASTTGGLAFDGEALDGEVEDHTVTISASFVPPALDALPSPIVIGGPLTLTGANFSAGSVIQLFVATSTGAISNGPYVPDAWTPTSLSWSPDGGIALGNGFGTLLVVNTDQGFLASNTESQLLYGNASLNIPTILQVGGTPLAAVQPSIPTAHADTLVAQGSTVTLSGTGFNDPLVNFFTADGNLGPLAPLGGDTDTDIQIVVPAGAPTGPASFVVVNDPYVGNVRSNAVSTVIGETISVTSVTQAGSTVTVRGTGFSTLSVINLFNLQGVTVVNLGGLDGSGAPRVPLTFVDETKLSFERPADAVSGPAFVQVLNPPFIPYSSTGNDPDGAFSFP